MNGNSQKIYIRGGNQLCLNGDCRSSWPTSGGGENLAQTLAIGNSAGSYNINMNGRNIQNVNKLTVNTIDPVYKINDKKYATYVSDMPGQKVEVVGQAKLKGDKLEIDLAKQPKGSDLWLFWQIVKPETIIPFVSPQSDALLYAYIDGSKLVVKLRAGQKNAKFSYRLIGTRLDHAGDRDNLYEDQSVKSYIDIDELRK
jgi:hypothetical protein